MTLSVLFQRLFRQTMPRRKPKGIPLNLDGLGRTLRAEIEAMIEAQKVEIDHDPRFR